MSLSKLARSIEESPTFALNEEARFLREKGEPVINMSIGEPKNKTPIAAILSSAAKLSEGNVKYTPPDGLPSLKRAIIRYTEDNYDRLVEPENIIISSGAKQCIYNILFSVIDPQDEVIVLSPYWVSYPQMIKMVYGVPVIVTPEGDTFHPRIVEIERAMNSRTKAIIVNSPNNPSGEVFSTTFISEIVEICEKKNIYLIMDDIYHKLVFDTNRWLPAYQYSHKELDSSMIVVVNGVAKLYGMTGFRIGWTIANQKLISTMTNVQAQTISCVSPVLQAAAEGALTGMQSVIENLRLQIQNNRDVIINELNSMNGIHVRKPKGTFYCLPDFRAYSNNSTDLCRFLLKKALVVTVPGKEFGMEGHLRLSYSGSVKEITEGIERIKWALDPSAPNEIYLGDRKVIRDWL
jgi:aspartate aminotransferase